MGDVYANDHRQETKRWMERATERCVIMARQTEDEGVKMNGHRKETKM